MAGDAHLSPRVAGFISDCLGHPARPVRDLGLREAGDLEIFQQTGRHGAILVTKDADFADLLSRLGPPPQVIWLTCGNTSEARLEQLFTDHLGMALELIERGEALVEISG